jgi:hypothetical protein
VVESRIEFADFGTHRLKGCPTSDSSNCVELTLAFVLRLPALSALTVVIPGLWPDIVNFNAAMQLWSDVLGDADDFGLQLTRVSTHDETEFGEQIERGVIAEYLEQPALTKYINAVGNSLVRHVSRMGIGYKFRLRRIEKAAAGRA